MRSFNETDTRAKPIDPALHARGWTENLIRREETAGAIEIVEGKPRKRARGRVDYLLRVAVNAESQPVAVALITDAIATTMNNLYTECCRQNNRTRLDPYALKCTASVGGAQYLADLRKGLEEDTRFAHERRLDPAKPQPQKNLLCTSDS